MKRLAAAAPLIATMVVVGCGEGAKDIGTLAECRERVIDTLNDDEGIRSAAERVPGFNLEALQSGVSDACSAAAPDATVGDVADAVRDEAGALKHQAEATKRKREADRDSRARAKAIVFKIREDHGDRQLQEFCWAIDEMGREYVLKKLAPDIDVPGTTGEDVFAAQEALCPEVGSVPPAPNGR